MTLPTATLVFTHLVRVTCPACGHLRSWNATLTKTLPDVGDTLECLACDKPYVIVADTLDATA